MQSDPNPPIRRRVRRWAIVLIVLLGGALLALRFYRFCYPLPITLAELVSPDGQLKVVITETPPHGFMMQSPWLYEYAIRDRNGVVLPGIPLEVSNDSCAIPERDFHATWADDEVTVGVGHHQGGCKGRIKDGRQIWD